MFERFTDRARRVVVLAQEEARTLHHSSIGTEHLLLGLIHEQDGLAAKALAQLGISLEVVRAKVRAIIGGEAAADEPSGHIPFTPRSKKVLELSLREALQLGHNYIGTEHILLGLIREGQGVGATVLTNLGADLDAVRTQVIRLMASAAAGGPLAPPGLPGRMSRTPAAAQAEVEARRLAAGGPVGSQHLLLAMVQQQDSMAAKALEGLGVTAEALRDRLARIEPAGTSDETPEEAGARRVGLRVEGSLVLLEIDDPDLAASLEKAMTARKVRVIRGTDPEAEGAGFPNVWSAVARSIDDMTRRLGKVVGAAPAAKPVPAPDWRPPALDPSAYTARYWMVSTGDGTSGSLEVGPGAGREAVRAFLRSWLAENRSSLAPPGASDEVGGAAVLWLAIDAEGDSFTMTDVGFGPGGPPRSRPVPMGTLVDAAVADLSAVT